MEGFAALAPGRAAMVLEDMTRWVVLVEGCAGV